VTAKRPSDVCYLDLTAMPIVGGFWIPWLPFPLPQRWPFCWWVAVAVDDYSRRIMGTAIFKTESIATEVTRLLGRVCLQLGRLPRHSATIRRHRHVRQPRRRRAVCPFRE